MANGDTASGNWVWHSCGDCILCLYIVRSYSRIQQTVYQIEEKSHRSKIFYVKMYHFHQEQDLLHSLNVPLFFLFLLLSPPLLLGLLHATGAHLNLPPEHRILRLRRPLVELYPPHPVKTLQVEPAAPADANAVDYDRGAEVDLQRGKQICPFFNNSSLHAV